VSIKLGESLCLNGLDLSDNSKNKGRLFPHSSCRDVTPSDELSFPFFGRRLAFFELLQWLRQVFSFSLREFSALVTASTGAGNSGLGSFSVRWWPWRSDWMCAYQRRLHLLVLFLLDTGCRISEALTLRISEIDFENLLVTLDGKGRKQRVVPFSFELRKAVCRYCKEANRTPHQLLFANRTQTKLGRRMPCGT
jgi:hypothetical protein